MNKNYYAIATALCVSTALTSQSLPNGMTSLEKQSWSDYVPQPNRGITTPPGGSLRNVAEWEEIQAVTITWTSYTETLAEIVRVAKEETTVIINCADSTQVTAYLSNNGIDTQNVTFIEQDYNSIWIRDYGPNMVYRDDVGELIFVDWTYNRPRPFDDAIPQGIADKLGVTMYETTTGANTLIATGGNFMSDGVGTAFSSHLITEENPDISETEVNSILNDFMGIETYVLMDVLPFDAIHHIDMHMKLLDEETLLVGEYPEGVADGPQIEANIQYVLSNFTSTWGTPYKVIRIPMPPDNNGDYPDDGSGWNTGDYYTYANATFLNNSVIVPVYNNNYDDDALQIWRDALPGYNIVGIDCEEIIQASGALHCITHEIATNDPMLIVHNDLEDTYNVTDDYTVDVRIQHASGISNAMLYYRTSTSGSFSSISMTETDAVNNIWSADIPAQNMGTTIQYYVEGNATSGKSQVRPMPAPEGYWEFDVLEQSTGIESNLSVLSEIYPNPASALTVIPVTFNLASKGSIELFTITGKKVATLFEGQFNQGFQNHFFNADKYTAGSYIVVVNSKEFKWTQKLMIK